MTAAQQVNESSNAVYIAYVYLPHYSAEVIGVYRSKAGAYKAIRHRVKEMCIESEDLWRGVRHGSSYVATKVNWYIDRRILEP